MPGNILIAYMTHSGNTRKIANLIHDNTSGIMIEIQPEIPYPNSYNAVLEQAKKEIQAGYKPALKMKIVNMESYDTIFIGSPNWWSTIAPPVATFLAETDFSGKTVVPFCTHGGGGAGRVLKEIARMCPGATIREGLVVYESGSGDTQAQISAWLRKIRITR